METKKIFVLGNGFDLAHYLPTAYIHFMEAMQVVENSHTSSELGFDDLFKSRLDNKDEFFLRTKELYKTGELILSAKFVNDLRDKLKCNGWFQHFKHHLSDVDTWIDFETEIENVLGLILILLEAEFKGNEILRDENGSFKALLRGKIIQNTGLIDFNVDFFDRFGIKSKILQQVFRNFKIFSTHYIIYDPSLEDNKQCYLTSKDVYDETQVSDSKIIFVQGKPLGNSVRKQEFTEIINASYLKRFAMDYVGFKEGKLFNTLSGQLFDFSKIFTQYISKFINEFSPVKSFLPIGVIGDNVEMVFTFNYSDTFQKFYVNQQNKTDLTKPLHGSAIQENIVFGINDLSDNLKKYKIYSFVKTYQKIINKTDFLFLDEKTLPLKQKTHTGIIADFNYEIVVWGHSLDISDEEYIKEIFNLNSSQNKYNVILIVLFHESEHSSLANLMNIMGKDIIQEWSKKGWLKFEKSPDIYQIYQDHYNKPSKK